MEIRIAGIEEESIVDGPGIRFTLFTQGCYHNCKGCHNPETHDVNSGYLVTVDGIYNSILSNPLLRGVTLSGGEPFLQAEALVELTNMIRANTKLDVMCYTGYTYEKLQDISTTDKYVSKLLKNIDILVDGPYQEKNRDLNLKFRGSTNQRILYLKEGNII